MSTIVTRAGKGSPLTNTELDSNFSNLNTDKLELSGGTLTGNLSLGDNVKAQFGASNDLALWHDGANSRILDAGTGFLAIGTNGTEIRLTGQSFDEFMAKFEQDGPVTLYHNHSPKIATTSTGADITGVLTADGLRVDTSATGGFKVEDRGSSGTKITSYQGTNNSNVRQLDLNAYKVAIRTGEVTGTAVTDRMLVSNNGDISFYNDSAAQAFHFDSSESVLSLGRTNGSSYVTDSDSLYVKGQIRVDGISNTAALPALCFNDTNTGIFYPAANSIGFSVGAYESLRLNADGSSVFSGSVTSPQLKTEGTEPTLFFNDTTTGHDDWKMYADWDQFYIQQYVNDSTWTSRLHFAANGNATFSGDVTAPIIKSTTHYEGISYRIYNSTLSNYGRLSSDSLGSVIMHTGAGEGARLTSTGLGIGCSPSSTLHIKTSVDNSVSQGLIIERSANTDRGYINYQGGAFRMVATDGDPIRFGHVSNSNEVSIHTDGSLLVGTTSTSLYNDTSGGGINLFANGGVTLAKQATSVSDPVLLLNNTGTAGQMIDLRQDGTTVGSIGVIHGNNLFIGAPSHSGLQFGGSIIYPTNGSNGNATNGVVDLGGTSTRFKDLYLSGQAYASYLRPTAGSTDFISFSLGAIRLATGGSESARIDTSGNLLVGQSTADSTSTGHGLLATGRAYHTMSSAHPLQLNRKSNDGDIAIFQRDGTTVGSIGTVGNDLVIGSKASGHKGVRFGSSYIAPINTSDAFEDNTTDLGLPAVRFKDLHLSGTANVGGVLELISNNSGFPTSGMVLNQNNFVYLRGGSNGLIMGKAGDNEAMRIDSSGNLLVGKTSANTYNNTNGVELQASGLITATRTGIAQILNREDSDGDIAVFRKDGTTVGSIGAKGGTAYLIGSNKGLRVSGSGLIPITTGGANSDATYDLGDPAVHFKDLYLSGTANANAIDIKSGSAIHGTITTSSSSLTLNARNTGILLFQSGGSEKMRIASNGTLYHGKTADSLNTGGLQTLISGQTSITQSYTEPLRLNRMSTEGAIQKFYYNGAEVGSVGTEGGDLTIGTGTNCGIQFNDGNDAIRPFNMAGNSPVDNAVSLGISTTRFKDLYLSGKIYGSTLGIGDAGIQADQYSNAVKPFRPDITSGTSDNYLDLGTSSVRWVDLYLSGGVYLGGTGAANKLDDYEEGTWTPVIADASTGGNVATIAAANGHYTKVGNLVNVRCSILNINTTGMTAGNQFFLQALPFTAISSSNLNVPFTALKSKITSTDGSLMGLVSPNTTHAGFYNDIAAVSGASSALVSQIDSTTGDLYIEFSYQV